MLDSWAKIEFLHRLVQLVLHPFWTVACIVSRILAVEAMNVIEFFTWLLRASCYKVTWFITIVTPHLVNSFIPYVPWASTGVVSHFLTFTTLYKAHVLLGLLDFPRSFELSCLAWRYKWSFSFGRLGSFLFPLFYHGIDRT